MTPNITPPLLVHPPGAFSPLLMGARREMVRVLREMSQHDALATAINTVRSSQRINRTIVREIAIS